MPPAAQSPEPTAGGAVRAGRAEVGRAVAGCLLAVLPLTGCGAGAISQTASQASGVDGYSGQVGTMLVRDATIEFTGDPHGAVYQPGDMAPLSMTLVNTGRTADRLLSVSSPVAGSGQVVGDPVVPGGRAVTVGNNGGADSQALSGRTIAIRLNGLVGPIRAGLTYPVTLSFERAGVLTAQLPVGYPPGQHAERGE